MLTEAGAGARGAGGGRHARGAAWAESLGRVNYGPRTGSRRASRAVCCTSGSSCTGCGRGGCVWTRSCPSGRRRCASEGPGEGRAGPVPFVRGGHGAGTRRSGCRGWARGFHCANGFCLGRYWSAGPREALYVPGPVLREGTNECGSWRPTGRRRAVVRCAGAGP
ncbi:hypothetical protein [Streptomyces sp. KL116D]|uniref:hypothetical protein n=1 Tax=Streptomyces sp. KL116D TaxID=3045152 RepID=UPI00355619CD